MSKSTVIPVTELKNEPYASIVCYPRTKPAETQARLQELHSLGVESIEFRGKSQAFTVPVLGKGYVGIVVVANVAGKRYALKMRRIDGGRDDLFHEAEMLKKANTVDVGPQLIAVSKNFLLSQLIDGDLLATWLETHKEKTVFRRILGDILEQCWRLDEAGVDHGELSKAPRHLLVDGSGQPFIVDFETASINRKVANVTGVCQYLFAGNSVVPRLVGEVLGEKDRNQTVKALKDYKKDRSRTRFEALLAACL
jgi:putative serine/threonine protein kinase